MYLYTHSIRGREEREGTQSAKTTKYRNELKFKDKVDEVGKKKSWKTKIPPREIGGSLNVA